MLGAPGALRLIPCSRTGPQGGLLLDAGRVAERVIVAPSSEVVGGAGTGI